MTRRTILGYVERCPWCDADMQQMHGPLTMAEWRDDYFYMGYMIVWICRNDDCVKTESNAVFGFDEMTFDEWEEGGV